MNVCPGNCRICNLGELRARALKSAAVVLLAFLGALLLSLSGCATVKTCAQPVTGQALQDGAAVLACAAGGKGAIRR